MRSSGEREVTMISDEERHEIARKLRELPARAVCDMAITLHCLIWPPNITYTGIDQLFARLADLIDRPSTTRHGKFRTKYGRETPCCEVCGYSIGDMRWGYCPKCGAVITDD